MRFRYEKIRVTKIEAARAQLKTAIRLWFEDSDPISIQTLVAATYSILHTLSRRKGAKGLLFDSRIIKERHRKQWVNILKSPSVFFKHADRDPDATITFSPLGNELFMISSCYALITMDAQVNMEENAFLFYITLSRPELLDEEARNNIPPEVFDDFGSVSKREFFKQFSSVWEAGLFGGQLAF